MDNQPDTTMAEPSVSGSTFIPAPITAASNKAPALAPGTFTSILPGIEDLLSIIYAIAEGDETGNEAVVNKAKEVAAQLTKMKNAAMSLPGGHMGNETITTLTQILEEQAEQKRNTLRAFVDTPTSVADSLAHSAAPASGQATAVPTPPAPAAA